MANSYQFDPKWVSRHTKKANKSKLEIKLDEFKEYERLLALMQQAKINKVTHEQQVD